MAVSDTFSRIDVESEAFLQASKDTRRQQKLSNWLNQHSPPRLITWLIALCLGSTATSLWLYLSAPPTHITDEACVRKLNLPSPVHSVFEYEEVQFDNQFWTPSPYKGKPTPELERKWQDLWYFGMFDLPVEYLGRINKSTEDRWTQTRKGGLLAGLEVFHNLHCLDLVRQYVHKDEYDYSRHPSFESTTPQQILAHVDHCIEALRIRLMCYADVTPFLNFDDPEKAGKTPDFNTQHRCPKFERIQEWARENAITTDDEVHRHGTHHQ